METASVRCELLQIMPRPAGGRLLALADVSIDIDGVVVEIFSVRLEREKDGISVRLPVDRDGRALVALPEPIREALAEVVIAGGIEAGVLRERAAVR